MLGSTYYSFHPLKIVMVIKFSIFPLFPHPLTDRKYNKSTYVITISISISIKKSARDKVLTRVRTIQCLPPRLSPPTQTNIFPTFFHFSYLFFYLSCLSLGAHLMISSTRKIISAASAAETKTCNLLL